MRLAEHDVSTDSDGAQPEDVAIAKVKHFEFFSNVHARILCILTSILELTQPKAGQNCFLLFSENFYVPFIFRFFSQ